MYFHSVYFGSTDYLFRFFKSDCLQLIIVKMCYMQDVIC